MSKEQLIVNNFLVIKEANFEVGKINVIIGSQATGKSLLTKLLYYFRKVINENIFLYNNKKDFIKNSILLFNKYFPNYIWKNEEFTILYKIEDIEIKLFKKIKERTVKMEPGEGLVTILKNIRFKTEKSRNKLNMKTVDRIVNHIVVNNNGVTYFTYKELNLENKVKNLLFIPANRSFFATLQKNIFSFLSEDIDIDPFIKEFGSHYERIKSIQNKETIKNKLIADITKKILNGNYLYQDKRDWIESDKKIINILNASSGQQEALPMLIMLDFYYNIKNVNIFIEEPEAHLFPISQKHIISLISLIYNNGNNIVMTTHSPYILTALNNYILAYDIMKKNGDSSIKGIVEKDFCINYNDVKAYTFENGKLNTIMDNENRLIGINIIDSVSDDFAKIFDTLLSLED